ncbi:MAG: AI-2E family transporter [Trueperaceae bacterium]|nr:MAG: AI-2E family transporter [Trueperaceae bacterium]
MTPGNDTPEVTAVETVWRNPWVRSITYVGAFIFVFWVLWRFRAGYTFALQVGLIGFVIAYILNPIVELLERIRLHRTLAVVLVYLLLLQLFVLGSLLISQVVTETRRFINLIPTAFDNMSTYAEEFSIWFYGLIDRLPQFLSDRFGVETTNDEVSQQVQEQLTNLLARAAEGVNALLERLITGGPNLLLTGATSLISATLQIFLILLASAYFLYDFPKFTSNFRRFAPLRWRVFYDDVIAKADRAVGGYLRGQLLITTILGFLIWIGLSLIGVPLALAISFLAAVFNLVPYLGAIIGVTPAVLLGFTTDGPFSPLLTSFLAIAVFTIVNQLEGNLLAPLILSRSVNLHPVTVLLAIITGLGLLGFVGALLAVPVVALSKVILEEYLLKRPAFQVPDAQAPPYEPEPSGEELVEEE